MRSDQLGRRGFVALVGGGAAASQVVPSATRAQQADRMRRVGLLAGGTPGDPEAEATLAHFQQGLERLGWVNGRNVRIDYRLTAGSPENYRRYAAELVALAPDVIVAAGTALRAVTEATRTVPIVFAFAVDPVGIGHVDSLAQPGGNVTGFVLFEYSLTAKWLQMLKAVAPGMTRVTVLRNAVDPVGAGQFAVVQSVAPMLGVDVRAINASDAATVERDLTAFARPGNGGLIVGASIFAYNHRDLIVGLAARLKLPTLYFERLFVTRGGLISYGGNLNDQYRLAAGYVDRILRGEKPANLPVQAPTNYELVINLQTAKTMGLTLPPSLLARADHVIE